jgi:hypothetical protein
VGDEPFVRRSLLVVRRADGPADPTVDALVAAVRALVENVRG